MGMEPESKRFFGLIAYVMTVLACWMLLHVFIGMQEGWAYSDAALWKRITFWGLFVVTGVMAVLMIAKKIKGPKN